MRSGAVTVTGCPWVKLDLGQAEPPIPGTAGRHEAHPGRIRVPAFKFVIIGRPAVFTFTAWCPAGFEFLFLAPTGAHFAARRIEREKDPVGEVLVRGVEHSGRLLVAAFAGPKIGTFSDHSQVGVGGVHVVDHGRRLPAEHRPDLVTGADGDLCRFAGESQLAAIVPPVWQFTRACPFAPQCPKPRFPFRHARNCRAAGGRRGRFVLAIRTQVHKCGPGVSPPGPQVRAQSL